MYIKKRSGPKSCKVCNLMQGVTYPCIHSVWAQWAPPSERSRMASLAFSGSFVGTVVAMPVSGIIADSLGWPAIFYITGMFIQEILS